MKLLVRLYHESRPIIAQVVKDTGILINVDRARSDAHEGEEALVDVPDEHCILISERMRSLGAEVRILEEGIRHDDDECVDCGACISICPKGVFYFDDEWKLQVNTKKCILCGRCIISCPHSALSLSY
ncbi:4Fe-4S dicluster domain-containing protein [Methanospirillum stamsii]|uniref:[Fe-S]-binding protein n=1 Tax=Methanospirillum stamsii TaxID=1277351 RepID=A0A2V2NID2_9EURY|nr:4Fe-4S dicluster domain-containing protein [Methanospirillum stamsii]PWR75103.1 [Fe-S]-binding protein [Methanospirillum stamsii]